MSGAGDASAMTEAFLELAGNMTQVLESVDGYRAQCVEHGYSPTAAERMAMDFHSHLVRLLFSGVSS